MAKTRLKPLCLCVCAGYLCRSKESAFFGGAALPRHFFMEGKTMGVYRELYYKLFGVMADAVESLERNEPRAAKNALIASMREAEETVISAEEEASYPRMK